MFGRLVTAMITPFKEDLSLDIERAKELADRLIGDGTDTVLVGGTTGESPTLTHEEKLSLYDAVIQHLKGRAKVMCGTGTNNTADSVSFSKEVEELKPDALLVVSPYYNKPPQDGLYRHFKAIASAVSIPIMIYNIPGRCGVNILPETMTKIADVENIVALKEAAGSVEQCALMVKATPEDFLIYSGDDGLTIPFMSVGAVGVVSVLGNIYGKRLKDAMLSFLDGDVKRASEEHRALLPLIHGLFLTANPIPVKAMIRLMGFDCGGVRLPLVDPDEALLGRLKKILTDLGLI